jgi:hypothetical protein
LCHELCVPKCYKDYIAISEDGNTPLHTGYKEEKVNISINEVPQDGNYDSDINKLYMLAAQE